VAVPSTEKPERGGLRYCDPWIREIVRGRHRRNDLPFKGWVCAAPAYLEQRGMPQHPRELARHDCLLFESLGRTWQFEKRNRPVAVEVRPKLSANDQFVLTVSALRGNGIALLPSYAVSNRTPRGNAGQVLPRFTVPTHWLRANGARGPCGPAAGASLVAFLKARYARCRRGIGNTDASRACARHKDQLGTVDRCGYRVR
jgi:DNA-binding transcriptional LysR family regulator